MAIDAFKDELIPLPRVPEVIVNPVHEATLYMWWKHGINGVKLETIKVGRKRYTTKEALAEFFHRRGTETSAVSAHTMPTNSFEHSERFRQSRRT